ncbi:hypothetical protein TNCV_4155751 [Trichonephila clavipes]|nr:hypothetical protein TNCV_4155751 [Trichonephila clavipes]
MLDRILIRGVRRPRHALDVFRFKEVINQHRSAIWRIIIHEYEVRTDSTSKQANIRLKNFVSVSLSSHRPRVKVMSFRYVSWFKTCSTFSPYRYPPRITTQTKPDSSLNIILAHSPTLQYVDVSNSSSNERVYAQT